MHSIRIRIHIHNSMRWKTTTTNFIEATLTRAREIIIIEIQMAFYIAIGCKLCTARWMNQSIWKMMAKFLIKFYRICLGYGWRWSKIDMYGISVDKSNVNWVEFRFSKKQPMKPNGKGYGSLFAIDLLNFRIGTQNSRSKCSTAFVDFICLYVTNTKI